MVGSSQPTIGYLFVEQTDISLQQGPLVAEQIRTAALSADLLFVEFAESLYIDALGLEPLLEVMQTSDRPILWICAHPSLGDYLECQHLKAALSIYPSRTAAEAALTQFIDKLK